MKQSIINFLQKIQLKGVKQLGKTAPTVLYPAHTLKRNPPLNYAGKGFEHEFEPTIDEMRLHDLHEVDAFITRGIVFKGRQVLLDSFIHPDHKSTYFNFYQYLFLRFRCKRIRLSRQETYILATNIWSHGLFHWVSDLLPRLFVLRERAKDLILLLPAHYEANDRQKGWTPFHKDSLAPFGFKAIEEVGKHCTVRASHLLMPSHAATTGNYNLSVMQGLRTLYHDYFVHQYAKPVVNLGERIYVTRTKALWRKVKNDDAVIEFMRSKGFAIVNFEDYSFAEKVQIAYHARYFVGIFSSGQTMAAFMQAGSFLLDFRLEDTLNLAIYSLCDAVGVHYLYQTEPPVDATTDDLTHNPQMWNLEVNIERLEANLALMLGE